MPRADSALSIQSSNSPQRNAFTRFDFSKLYQSILASSLPRSLTGVPVLGDDTLQSASSSGSSILPGHQEPFLLRTHTIGPTQPSSAAVAPVS
uniref:Uncharacterized protein n=1 Tax=Rhizophora mucronata TaxID=61149 RepID=A0A2P2KC87_RHIMU